MMTSSLKNKKKTHFNKTIMSDSLMQLTAGS